MITTLNAQALATVVRLAQTFGLSIDEEALGSSLVAEASPITIGIEIEVPWSSYFPGLWREFRLDQRRVADLGAEELSLLTNRCAELEVDLRARLTQTMACGVPRGNDRYWEFSLRPVHDVTLLLEQVRLLGAAGVLPRDRGHSLHVTIGGLPRIPAVYYLALALEAHFVSPQRIEQGVGQALATIHTGWARKGSAGILQKGASELEGGAEVAVELRMLQLPQAQEDFVQLLHTVQWSARAIHQWMLLSQGLPCDEEAAQAWAQFQAEAKLALQDHGLPDRLWHTGSSAVDTLPVWRRFCEALLHIKETLPLPVRSAQNSKGLMRPRIQPS